MKNEIVKAGQAEVRTSPVYSREQIELIKTQICSGTTDGELKVFLAVCQRTGLDPFKKQIYGIVRGQKLTIQTSIDGYRLIAQRSNKYRGREGPLWCGEDGKWVDVWLKEGSPAAAKVGVKHADFAETLWGMATWASFAQRNAEGRALGMWAKMPDQMLAKCAEAQAIRAAFPEDTAGIYSEEEMSQADASPEEALVPIRKQIEDGLAQVRSEQKKALMLDELKKIGNERGALTSFHARLKRFLAVQSAQPVSKAGGVAEGHVAAAPVAAIGAPPAKEITKDVTSSALGAQVAGPEPVAAPASTPAPSSSVEPPVAVAASAAATGGTHLPGVERAPDPKVDLGFVPEERGDAWEGDDEPAAPGPIRVPSVEEILRVIGPNERLLAGAIVQACAAPDVVLVASTTVFERIVALEGGQLAAEEKVAQRWLGAGGALRWVFDKKLGRKTAILTPLTARELVAFLGLDKTIAPAVKP